MHTEEYPFFLTAFRGKCNLARGSVFFFFSFVCLYGAERPTSLRSTFGLAGGIQRQRAAAQGSFPSRVEHSPSEISDFRTSGGPQIGPL